MGSHYFLSGVDNGDQIKHEGILVPRMIRKGNLGLGMAGGSPTLLGGIASWDAKY